MFKCGEYMGKKKTEIFFLPHKESSNGSDYELKLRAVFMTFLQGDKFGFS
jgi:hypothetical protein